MIADKYDDCSALSLSTRHCAIIDDELLQLADFNPDKEKKNIKHPLTGQLHNYLYAKISENFCKKNILEIINKHELVLMFDIHLILGVSICRQYTENPEKQEISKYVTNLIWRELYNYIKEYNLSPLIIKQVESEGIIFNKPFENNKLIINSNKLVINKYPDSVIFDISTLNNSECDYYKIKDINAKPLFVPNNIDKYRDNILLSTITQEEIENILSNTNTWFCIDNPNNEKQQFLFFQNSQKQKFILIQPNKDIAYKWIQYSINKHFTNYWKDVDWLVGDNALIDTCVNDSGNQPEQNYKNYIKLMINLEKYILNKHFITQLYIRINCNYLLPIASLKYIINLANEHNISELHGLGGGSCFVEKIIYMSTNIVYINNWEDKEIKYFYKEPNGTNLTYISNTLDNPSLLIHNNPYNMDLICVMNKMVLTKYPVFLMIIYRNNINNICNVILDDTFHLYRDFESTTEQQNIILLSARQNKFSVKLKKKWKLIKCLDTWGDIHSKAYIFELVK